MHGLQKIFLWTSFIIFLSSLLLRQEAAIIQDLGRHLRLGQMIVFGGAERSCALYKNCLTYTFPDYPFINHHWGSEVLFYLIHRLDGFRGIILFKSAVLGLTFAITVFHATSRGRSSGNQRTVLSTTITSIVLTFLSVQMMSDRLTTRPEIFGYLFFALLFWMLDRKYRAHETNWIYRDGMIPMIMVLWVNLHISFIFGLILIWMWAISSIFEGPTLLRRVGPYRIFAISAISTILTILNPSSLRGAFMPLTILKDYGYSIAENVTPFFLSSLRPLPEYWMYVLLLIATTILAFSTRKSGVFGIIVLLAFSIIPLIAVRHLSFFALAIPPVLTPLIITRSEKYLILLTDPLAIGTSVILIILAFTNPTPLSFFPVTSFGLRTDSRYNGVTQFIKNHQFQGNLWNDYDIGSYLEWAVPQYKTFVDGRPEAFPVKFFKGIYIPMQLSKENWNSVVDGYHIEWAVVALTENPDWFRSWWQMIQLHQDWSIVYHDSVSAVLIKKDGINDSTSY